MKTIIKEMSHLFGMEHGWGNGYVLIPEGHPFHGKSYDEIHNMTEIEVNGGLTFSQLVDDKMIERWCELSEEDKGFWIIGFDTAHYGDSLAIWPKEAVQEEADLLAKQIEKYIWAK